MLLETLLAGGLYNGFKALTTWKNKDNFIWLANDGKRQPVTISSPPSTSSPDFVQIEHQINKNLAVSSLSLGISLITAGFYGPLRVVDIPLLIYSSIPIFKQAYNSLFYKKQARFTIFVALLIAGGLAFTHYTTASLIQWVYYVNQKLFVELGHSYRKLLGYLLRPNSQLIWVAVDNVEVAIPQEDIRVDDIVVLTQGEVIPFDGVITSGSALINMFVLTGQHEPVEKKPDDFVFAATVVHAGQICVKVKRI